MFFQDAMQEKFKALEDKDVELRQLKNLLRERDRDIERANQMLLSAEESIDASLLVHSFSFHLLLWPHNLYHPFSVIFPCWKRLKSWKEFVLVSLKKVQIANCWLYLHPPPQKKTHTHKRIKQTTKDLADEGRKNEHLILVLICGGLMNSFGVWVISCVFQNDNGFLCKQPFPPGIKYQHTNLWSRMHAKACREAVCDQWKCCLSWLQSNLRKSCVPQDRICCIEVKCDLNLYRL